MSRNKITAPLTSPGSFLIGSATTSRWRSVSAGRWSVIVPRRVSPLARASPNNRSTAASRTTSSRVPSVAGWSIPNASRKARFINRMRRCPSATMRPSASAPTIAWTPNSPSCTRARNASSRRANCSSASAMPRRRVPPPMRKVRGIRPAVSTPTICSSSRPGRIQSRRTRHQPYANRASAKANASQPMRRDYSRKR